MKKRIVATLASLMLCGAIRAGEVCTPLSDPSYEVVALEETTCTVCEFCSWDWVVRDINCTDELPSIDWAVIVGPNGQCRATIGCDQPDAPCCTYLHQTGPGGEVLPDPVVCDEGIQMCPYGSMKSWIWGCPDPLIGEVWMTSFVVEP